MSVQLYLTLLKMRSILFIRTGDTLRTGKLQVQKSYSSLMVTIPDHSQSQVPNHRDP